MGRGGGLAPVQAWGGGYIPHLPCLETLHRLLKSAPLISLQRIEVASLALPDCFGATPYGKTSPQEEGANTFIYKYIGYYKPTEKKYLTGRQPYPPLIFIVVSFLLSSLTLGVLCEGEMEELSAG